MAVQGRVRLADGLVTKVAGTQDVDKLTVTTGGRLVLQRRLDMAAQDSPTRITLTGLDGSGPRDLAFPVGENRDVTFRPDGTRVAFVRYTTSTQGTVWVAAADGSRAWQVSDRLATWLNPQCERGGQGEREEESVGGAAPGGGVV